MSQAVASIYDRFVAAQPPSGSISPVDNAPRYVVQFGYHIHRVDTSAIPGRFIMRGEITPCTGYQTYAIRETIPQEMRVMGSERVNRATGVEMRYSRYAGPEASRLIGIEEATPDGIRILDHLTGQDPFLILRDLRINEIFYPDGAWTLPVLNVDVIKYLKERKQAIKDETAFLSVTGKISKEKILTDHKDLFLQTADALIEAANYANGLQLRQLEFTHQCMKISPADPSGLYKREYDAKDEERLIRTGKPRVEAAADQTASAIEKLAQIATTTSQAAAESQYALALKQTQAAMLAQQTELEQMRALVSAFMEKDARDKEAKKQ